MKKISRRNFLKIAGATAAATSLAACGATSSSSDAATSTSTSTADSTASEGASTEPVTLKVTTWDLDVNPINTTLAEAFMAKFPHITIEFVDTPSADYTQKLSVMLNGGSDVDVIYVKDADTSPGLAEKGQLEDLTSYVADAGIDISIYNGVADNFVMEDGKLIGLPGTRSYYILYFNKDIFDAAGVDYPTNDMTWAEFEETAKAITAGEGADKKYGALIHTWQACVINWGFASGEHSVLDTDFEYLTPYYEMALRMQNDDQSSMDYATLKTGSIHYSSPFLLGNVGMMPMGQWFMATVLAKVETGESSVNWGIATIPHDDTAPQGYVVGSASPICINAASEKKDAAWEYVKFVSGEEAALLYAEFGSIPSYNNPEALNIIASVDGMPEGVAEALVVEHFSLDRPLHPKAAEANAIIGAEHDLIMLGESDLATGLGNMGQYVGELLES